MKSILTASFLSVVIIAAGILYSSKIDRFAAQLLEKNNEIYTSLTNEDYTSAQKLVASSSEYLKRYSTALQATGDHSEITQLEINLTELGEYIKAEQKADALAKSSSLNILIRSIPINYKMKFENIL